MSSFIAPLSHISRPLLLAAGIVLGACAGGAATTIATQLSSPTVPPSAPSSGATVVCIEKAAKWQVGGGKASVQALAHGKNAWLGKLTMAGRGKVPLHRDATEEYIHVLSGAGAITVDGVTSKIAAGDTVYMPANAEVTYANGPEPLVALQVFAGPAPAKKYTKWQRVNP